MNTSQYTAGFWTIIDGRTKEYNLSPKASDLILVIGGTVHITNQTGGFVRLAGTTTAIAIGQRGGFLESIDTALIESHEQVGGHVQAFGNSILRSYLQSAGVCRAYGENTSFYAVSGRTGGVCEHVNFLSTVDIQGE